MRPLLQSVINSDQTMSAPTTLFVRPLPHRSAREASSERSVHIMLSIRKHRRCRRGGALTACLVSRVSMASTMLYAMRSDQSAFSMCCLTSSSGSAAGDPW